MSNLSASFSSQFNYEGYKYFIAPHVYNIHDKEEKIFILQKPSYISLLSYYNMVKEKSWEEHMMSLKRLTVFDTC
jgi:hypothetical protein